VQPPDTITCVECGGVASLLTFLPEDGELDPETPVAYRCADCMERFDVVMGDPVED
jgi:DNA-directed RNA polymerase subunit RPC12/RpoP